MRALGVALAVVAVAILTLTTLAHAASFTFYATIPCPGYGDMVVSWPGYDVPSITPYQRAYVGIVGASSNHYGAAIPPKWEITGAEVTHEGAPAGTSTVLGKLDINGTGGDYLTTRFYGSGSSGVTQFPSDNRPLYLWGDALHIHTNACGLVLATIYFRVMP